MENIDKKIEETLNALGGITPAEPNPFFYTRLKARMENTQQALPKPMQWIMKPSVIFGTLAVVLIMNVVSIMSYERHNQSVDSNTIDGFTEEYGLKSE